MVGRSMLIFAAGVIAHSILYASHVDSATTSLFTKRNIFRQYVLIAIFFLIGLSFILPPGMPSGNGSAQGHDVMVVLDVSQSMQVQDISYEQTTTDRLTAAKTAIAGVVEKALENRRGLVVYAGEAVGITPLTYDAELFLTFLAGVDHENVTTQGTNISAALTVASSRFDTGDTVGRIILLVSDGGDEEVVLSNETNALLKEMNISVIVRGVGSSKGGYIPEGMDPFGNVVYKQYQGQQVVSKYSETALRSVAKATDRLLVHMDDIDSIASIIRRFETIEKRTFAVDAGIQQMSVARRPLVGVGLCITLYCLCLIPGLRSRLEPLVDAIIQAFYSLKRSLGK